MNTFVATLIVIVVDSGGASIGTTLYTRPFQTTSECNKAAEFIADVNSDSGLRRNGQITYAAKCVSR